MTVLRGGPCGLAAGCGFNDVLDALRKIREPSKINSELEGVREAAREDYRAKMGTRKYGSVRAVDAPDLSGRAGFAVVNSWSATSSPPLCPWFGCRVVTPRPDAEGYLSDISAAIVTARKQHEKYHSGPSWSRTHRRNER